MGPPGYQTGYAYPQAAPQFVDVTIRGTTEPLVVELYHPLARPGSDLPIARCTVPCRAHIPAGRYKLFVQEGPNNVSGSRQLDVSAPSTIQVEPKSGTQRGVGLGLGIGGAVGIVAGSVLIISAIDFCYDGGSGCSRDDNDARAGTGLVLLLAGLVATPVGWIMFGKSFKPNVSVAPAGAQFGFSPTVFPARNAAGAVDGTMPGFVFNGRF